MSKKTEEKEETNLPVGGKWNDIDVKIKQDTIKMMCTELKLSIMDGYSFHRIFDKTNPKVIIDGRTITISGEIQLGKTTAPEKPV